MSITIPAVPSLGRDVARGRRASAVRARSSTASSTAVAELERPSRARRESSERWRRETTASTGTRSDRFRIARRRGRGARGCGRAGGGLERGDRTSDRRERSRANAGGGGEARCARGRARGRRGGREGRRRRARDDDDAPRTGSGRVNARVDVVGKRVVRVMSSRARGRARWMDGEAWMGEMKARAAERRGRRRRRRRRRRPGREFGARARDEVSLWVVFVPLMILAGLKTRKRRRRRRSE